MPEDIESSHPPDARNTWRERTVGYQVRRNDRFNDPYQITRPSYTVSLLIVSARRKSRQPDSCLEHPVRRTNPINDRPPPRQIRIIPEQLPDKLTEVYPFFRDEVKGQFTSVPAPSSVRTRAGTVPIHHSPLELGVDDFHRKLLLPRLCPAQIQSTLLICQFRRKQSTRQYAVNKRTNPKCLPLTGRLGSSLYQRSSWD